MKAYITKWPLTRGILEVDDAIAITPAGIQCKYGRFYGREWFESLEDARSYVRGKIQKAILELRKKLKNLEDPEFQDFLLLMDARTK